MVRMMRLNFNLNLLHGSCGIQTMLAHPKVHLGLKVVTNQLRRIRE